MKIFHFAFLTILALSQANCQQPAPNQNAQPQPDRPVGGSCECCEAWAHGLPENLSWQTTIAPPGEPGEPLDISGTVFKKDGKTPADGVILYLYHTDAEGNYSDGPDISTCAQRHGHLRGWVKTGPDGRYRFRTIRPATYPNTTVAQHIHATIKEPGLTEYWIDSYFFDDDPNLPEQIRNGTQKRCGSGILTLKKNEDGVWTGERDIVLGLHVPGYQ